MENYQKHKNIIYDLVISGTNASSHYCWLSGNILWCVQDLKQKWRSDSKAYTCTAAGAVVLLPLFSQFRPLKSELPQQMFSGRITFPKINQHCVKGLKN